VLKIFGHTFNREDFFIEGLFPDFMAPPGNPFLVSSLRINLPDPPGIPVTGRADQETSRMLAK